MLKENDPKLIAFAKMLERHQLAELVKQGYDLEPQREGVKVRIVAGKVYHKVNVGSGARYMVGVSDEVIYGCKGYGVVHKGHMFGKLNSINDFYWGKYYGRLRHPNDPVDSIDTEQNSEFIDPPKEPKTIPVIGMGVTQLYITDRRPWTITEVIDGHTIVIQEDNAEMVNNLTGEYKYTSNFNGEKKILTWRKNGSWQVKGKPTKSAGYHWAIGERRKYVDLWA